MPQAYFPHFAGRAADAAPSASEPVAAQLDRHHQPFDDDVPIMVEPLEKPIRQGLLLRRTRRRLENRRLDLIRRQGEFAAESMSQRKTLALEDQRLRAERAEIDERLARLGLLLTDRVAGFGHIAKAWADWELALSKQEANYLRHKKHPAKTAAQVMRDKGREMAELRRQLKLAEYITALYEWHFPWLGELRDVEAELDYVTSGPDADDRDDPAARYLSTEEYTALSTAERNQRALDRYLRSRQTPWQLGRDYERYVGYLREQAGFAVTYHGILKGFEDLGRDVLAERDGTIEVIQCKRWAQHKTIHEKHVFQLYGTMVAAQIENPGATVTGTFVTTTALSERARQFADVLGIHVNEKFPIADYPRIKCNIARRTDGRIYHLPFDQQYDQTVVEPHRGERYVQAVAEAEELGFRRAWRWHGPAPPK